MKRLLKIAASCLLLLNGIAAIFGGANLIDKPDGSNLSISPDWLRHSPFHNYYIPGLILLVCNGLFSMAVLAMLVIDFKKYSLYIMAQGVILTGWIVIQVLLLEMVVGLHVLMALVGIALVLIGRQLAKMEGLRPSGKQKTSRAAQSLR